MQAALVILLVCGCLKMVVSQGCVLASDYICKVLPQSFPSGLSSIVLLISNMGELNYSTFRSETLESVTSLTIANAGVTGVSAGAFQSFSQLTKLNMYQNNLSKISASWFYQPAKLENLNLVQNNIEILEEKSLIGLSGLTRLNLAQNRLHAIAVGTFLAQQRLAHLNLSGNRLTRVSPETFFPLRSTQIRLDNNPWDCSCGGQDFVLLLKGMINASLLENKMEVICETPALLRGQAVWNVSECISPTTSVPNKEVLPQTGVLAIIGLLGALCILFCVVCPLTMFYKRKQKTNVEPELENPDEDSILEQSGPQKKAETLRNSGDHTQDASALRSIRVRGRAKSVGAMLSTCKFSHQSSEAGNEGLPGQTELHSEEKGSHIRMSELDKTEQKDTGTTFLGDLPTQVTENLPYLCIGTNTANQSPGCPEDHHVNNMSQGRGREIRRMSTWPPTSDQWKEPDTSEREIFGLFLPSPAGGGKIICDSEQCLDGFKREHLSLESPLGDRADGVFPREDRGFPIEEDFKSGIETATLEGDRVLLGLAEEPVGQSHTHSYQVSTKESSCPSEPHDESNGASLKLSMEWGEKRGTQYTGGVEHQEGKHGSNSGSSSIDSPAGSTPQDDNLLQNNEYAFIDLLHEVVQNQGRWTRDRWKQTHLNKQKSKKQGHTH